MSCALVSLSYLLISDKEATLFVDEAKFDVDSKKVFADALVREKLAPRTQGAAREWLERNTRPI